MSERKPEQIRAVGQAVMRQDTAARRVVEKQYVARANLDMDGLKELVGVVAGDRGLRQIVDIGGEIVPNKFFGVSEEDGVLTVKAIAEVQQDIWDEVSGKLMVSGNEYLDFSDEEFREVQDIFRI